jgi:hypothetical protein
MQELGTFDWAKAIEINRIALSRIVAELFAMLGLVAGGTVERLPHALYLAAERLLRPTESALRRLIVIVARGVVVKPSVKRPMPKGLVIVGKGPKRMMFRLFDTLKKFDFIVPRNPLIVMVKTYTDNPFNLFNSFNRSLPTKKTGGPNAMILCRRLAAVAHALETLPSQAKRMARWQMQRKTMVQSKFISPLRPGPPPGTARNLRQKSISFCKNVTGWHGIRFDRIRLKLVLVYNHNAAVIPAKAGT